MSNPRGRDLLALSANNSQPARLPAIPTVSTDNQDLNRFIAAATERLQVREGERGNPFERVLTARDLVDLGLIVPGTGAAGKDPTVLLRQPSGLFAGTSVDEFAARIRDTKLFRDLITSLNDAKRFDYLPEVLRAELLKDLTDAKTLLGTAIRRLEIQQSSDTEATAFALQEVRAAINGAQAGVRQVQFATTEINKAIAGQVTQVKARLDHFSVNGAPGVATVEQVMQAVADRTKGLSAEWFVKVQAGNKIAGVGLAATEDPFGTSRSGFYVMVDDFAVVSSTDDTSGGAPANRFVFGIDTTTDDLFINGNVHIRTKEGDTIASSDVASNSRVPAINFIGRYAAPPSTAGLKKNAVYQNTTDGNSYILNAAGAWEQYLTSGQRGSRTVYVPGSAWSDGVANDAITATTGSPQRVIGDTVIISSAQTNFSATRYWDGFNWSDPGVVIDGNLLVNGSIAGQKIAADQISAGHLKSGSITAEKMAARSVTAENGAIADLAVDTLKIADQAVTVPQAATAYSPHVEMYFWLPGQAGARYKTFILTTWVQSYYSIGSTWVQRVWANGINVSEAPGKIMEERPIAGTLATKGTTVELEGNCLYKIWFDSDDSRNSNGSSLYVLTTKK